MHIFGKWHHHLGKWMHKMGRWQAQKLGIICQTRVSFARMTLDAEAVPFVTDSRNMDS